MSRDMKPKRIFKIYKTLPGYFAFFEGSTENYHERKFESYRLEDLLDELSDKKLKHFVVSNYYLYEAYRVLRDSTYLFSYDPNKSPKSVIKQYPEYFI